jgi:hypothetical protein
MCCEALVLCTLATVTSRIVWSSTSALLLS